MSGLAMGFGQPARRDVQRMSEKIKHRGPDLAGMWGRDQALMAQNYLQADLVSPGHPLSIPVASEREGKVRICYDGQLGHREALRRQLGLTDGPFPEERLLLQLYHQSGCDMFRYLSDATFAFVISDGTQLLAARDLLGIKTLFYGFKNGTLYLASELKSIIEVTEDIYEFPPGHYMDAGARLIRFAELPHAAPETLQKDTDTIATELRTLILNSLAARVRFSESTGALLSGGLDSSVVCSLASRQYKKHLGQDARLQTFGIGVGESDDIHYARLAAGHIGSDHHELIITLDDLLQALPEVLYYLESFDPSLVRSAASNFLICRYAKQQGIDVLLSGEGGDEVFCGYSYFKQCAAEDLHARQIECLGFLHNNASLRLDRMNQCHSLRVITPFISGELLDYALCLPAEYKQKPAGSVKIEKWILRKAFEGELPESILWRPKQEFSQGTASADVLPKYFEAVISDDDFTKAQEEYPFVRSKEELHYFRVFADHFGTGNAVGTVGQWISL